ncbi:MAG: sodium:alanine symporter family protein [Clostridiales bacterium]|nr:sodium:alanine symporter family protein [Clostridiales bacterium]
MINNLLTLANTYLLGPGLTVAVLICGLLLIVRLKPFVLLHPKRTFTALTEKPADGMSPAKAMCVALAGTLGVGNIAGVSSAIAVGGAGAIFWMWVSAFAAMPIKYAEIVLAVKHRRKSADSDSDANRYHGGAHFYISDLAELGLNKRCAKYAAMLFATLCLATSLTMGCAVQSNAIAVSISELTGMNPLIFGVILAIIAYIIIAGGLKRISDLTVKLIPLMSAVYIIMSLYIVFTNINLVGSIFGNIVSSALNPAALGGGIIGFITNRALAIGVTRGIVSNEAGCGTAPIAHASANVKSPAIQGLWGIIEVFVDTIVICSMTAFVVLIGEARGILISADGMAAALNAFECFIPFAKLMITVAILVFAFCTIICWFYYGTESLGYLTKNTHIRKLYTIIYAVCIVLGALASDGLVWSLADFTVSAMTAVNIVAVMLYVPEIKYETELYFKNSRH